jgi:hypothetical protein
MSDGRSHHTHTGVHSPGLHLALSPKDREPTLGVRLARRPDAVSDLVAKAHDWGVVDAETKASRYVEHQCEEPAL